MSPAMTTCSRRTLLGGAGSTFALAALPFAAHAAAPQSFVQPIAAPAGGALAFDVFRKGDRIGTHELTFSGDRDRLDVRIDIRLEVSFAFLTLYDYRHESRETWADGRLIGLETRTDDNGDEFRVSARADRDRLLVDGSGGAFELPGDTLPTSYWHEYTVQRGQWLDSQKGVLVRSDVSPPTQDELTLPGRELPAQRYTLAGDLDCELWYHRAYWVGLRFAASDGSTIDYRLRRPSRFA